MLPLSPIKSYEISLMRINVFEWDLGGEKIELELSSAPLKTIICLPSAY